MLHKQGEHAHMPYRITKEGNISHTSLHWLLKLERVCWVLAIITVGCLITFYTLK